MHQHELSAYLNCLKIQFDVILLTETRSINQSITEKEFPNFDLYIDPPTISFGGASILVRKDMCESIEPLDNLKLKSNCQCTKCLFESKFIKLKLDNNDLIVECIYRHPNGNPLHFIKEYSDLLGKLNTNATHIIGGDFNLNLLDYDKQYIREYVNNIKENNFIPCITLPTRITSHSATLIDHIMVRVPKSKIQCKVNSGNLICDITDHLANFTILDLNIRHQNYRPYIRLFMPNKIIEFNININLEMSLLDNNIDENLHTRNVNIR